MRLLSLHRLAAVVLDEPPKRIGDEPGAIVLVQVTVGLGAHALARRRVIRYCAQRYHRGRSVTRSRESYTAAIAVRAFPLLSTLKRLGTGQSRVSANHDSFSRLHS